MVPVWSTSISEVQAGNMGMANLSTPAQVLNILSKSPTHFAVSL